MGKRLTKIYTRTGDDGSTGLGSGERVRKDSPRIEACGSIDELNSTLGVLLATAGLPGPLAADFAAIQHRLFDLGAELAVPGRVVLDDGDVSALENLLDQYNAPLPPLQDFVLPGGNPAAAAAHVARAVCRRTERRGWALARSEPVNPASLRYLNRLSDLLFVIARVLARQDGGSEVIWQARRSSERG